MNDSQRKTVRLGDYFAYAVRDGNSSAMNFGRVIELGEASGNPPRQNQIKAVTVTAAFTDGEEWHVSQRSQWLADYSRLIVVPREALSSTLAALIDETASVRGFNA